MRAWSSSRWRAKCTGPLRRAVYKVDAKGVKTRLTNQEGTNSASFSANFVYYVNRYSSARTPTVITVNETKTKWARRLRLITVVDVDRIPHGFRRVGEGRFEGVAEEVGEVEFVSRRPRTIRPDTTRQPILAAIGCGAPGEYGCRAKRRI